MALARMSVFTPDLRYTRSFRVPPHWAVGSISFLPDGRLLLAAYGPGESGGLHVLTRQGELQQTFGPSFNVGELRGFEGSLLGGYATIIDGEIAYTTKSPYAIWFYDLRGRPLRQCAGRREWTTDPASVLETRGASTALRWNQYVHSSNLVGLGGGRLLNQVLDPSGDRTVMDVITRDCRLLRRSATPTPMTVTHASGTRLVAVRTLDYPEVIVYEQRLER
jgi:hypothetical protein